MPRGTDALTLPGQTLAIAQFTLGAERGLRDGGRPFETVQRIANDRFDNSRGFRLRVIGRIAAAGGDRYAVYSQAEPNSDRFASLERRLIASNSKIRHLAQSSRTGRHAAQASDSVNSFREESIGEC